MIRLFKESILVIYFSMLMILAWFFPNAMIAYLFLASILCLLCLYFNKPKKLLFLQVLFVLQQQYYVSLMLLPAQVSYLSDIIVLLVAGHFFNHIKEHSAKQTKQLIYRMLSIFFIYIMLGVITNVFYQFNIILMLWSLRNMGRFIIFFVAALLFMEQEDVDKYKQVGTILLGTCGALSILQYAGGYKGDWLGGIFGIQQGIANIYLHVFLIIFLVYVMTKYFFDKMNFLIFLIALSYIIGLTIISELKFLFFEIFYVGFIVVVFKKWNVKVLMRFLVSSSMVSLLIVLSIPVFLSIFPNFSDFFSMDAFLEVSKSADGLGENSLTIGRSSFFNYITREIFENNIIKMLFGIGMGNAEYSRGQQLLTSDFFNHFQYTLYFWYSSAWMYIENGMIGMILYFSIFITYAKYLYNFIEHHVISAFSFIFILCLPLFYFYNSTLRIDIAYIVVVALAAGNVYVKEKNTYIKAARES